MGPRTRYLLLTCLILAGCGHATVYYADGVDLATRDADFSICAAQAQDEFPTRTVFRTTSRTFTPPMQACDASGNCITRPGYWQPGQRYLVDGNAEPRAAATRGCMGTRGYARITLPSCGVETAMRYSSVMPPLGPDTCLHHQAGGQTLILNPDEG